MMWIRFDDDQLEALRALVALGKSCTVDMRVLLAAAEKVEGRIDFYADPDANNQAFRDAVQTSDELEMDDDAVTSIGNEGAFVMTWTYVTNEEGSGARLTCIV